MRLLQTALLTILVTACSSSQPVFTSKPVYNPQPQTSAEKDMVTPALNENSRTPVWSEFGIASFYANKYQNRLTANGERFDQDKLTAAHKSLPFGTVVKVVNAESGRSVVVRINDRGPFITGRIIDLSYAAFTEIADPGAGLAEVEIEILN